MMISLALVRYTVISEASSWWETGGELMLQEMIFDSDSEMARERDVSLVDMMVQE